MTVSEQKKALRAQIRAKEQALSPEYKAAADGAIVEHLLALPEYQGAKTVFCFVGTAREIDTRPLLRHALAAGKALCVPLCVGAGLMEPRRIFSLDQLKEGFYGLWEPGPDSTPVDRADIDLSIIPCVTCDRAGRRLGQGGGFYDRFFADDTGRCALICREALLSPQIPLEGHDLAFPTVITENGVFPPRP